ncbi:HSP90-domain-containing protein [Gymnopus androsaceus JB14]|uniref:HSP90-domain-containing protein n=1 Tax=Gymnopus androsaceus JB14 TaxID=1447944 RepID=A0A6A4H6J8_9AGAR|nr:HSP90-domain-containing protein [Gymnopus androsaceus JB14]
MSSSWTSSPSTSTLSGISSTLLTEDKDNFSRFYKAFGKNLELSIYEDAQDRSMLPKFLRFFSTMIKHRSRDALGDKVEKVIVSNRITDSPCVLVTGQFSSSLNMGRIMNVQVPVTLQMTSYMATKKTLELNTSNHIESKFCLLISGFALDELISESFTKCVHPHGPARFYTANETAS